MWDLILAFPLSKRFLLFYPTFLFVFSIPEFLPLSLSSFFLVPSSSLFTPSFFLHSSVRYHPEKKKSCLLACLSACLSARLPVCPPACLPARLSARLPPTDRLLTRGPEHTLLLLLLQLGRSSCCFWMSDLASWAKPTSPFFSLLFFLLFSLPSRSQSLLYQSAQRVPQNLFFLDFLFQIQLLLLFCFPLFFFVLDFFLFFPSFFHGETVVTYVQVWYIYIYLKRFNQDKPASPSVGIPLLLLLLSE